MNQTRNNNKRGWFIIGFTTIYKNPRLVYLLYLSLTIILPHWVREIWTLESPHTHTHFLKIIHMIWIIYDLNMKHMNRISESCVNFNHKDFAWLYYIHLCSFDREWSWLWMLSDSSWAHLAQWFLMGSYDPWLLPPLMVFFFQCLTGMKPFLYFLHELNMVAMDQRSVLHWQENMSHSWKKVIQCTLDLRKPFTLISEVIIPISFGKKHQEYPIPSGKLT